MDIKPIETYYNGYRFRSRLEARWAVFFDAMKVEYEYEPEGFKLSNGETYLPDFYLSKYNIYVEIKPCGSFSISYNNECVTFDENSTKYFVFMKDATSSGYGVLFVFGDPFDALLFGHNGAKGESHLFCECTCLAKALSYTDDDVCICNEKEQIISQCNNPDELVSGQVLAFTDEFVLWGQNKQFIPRNALAMPISVFEKVLEDDKDKYLESLKEYFSGTFKACVVARQARFEHGENPLFHATKQTFSL